MSAPDPGPRRGLLGGWQGLGHAAGPGRPLHASGTQRDGAFEGIG